MSDWSEGRLAGLIEERLGAAGAEPIVAMPGSEAVRAVLRAIERTWDLVIPERLLEEVRDRSELVQACVTRVRRHLRLKAGRRPLPGAGRLRVWITPPRDRGSAVVARGGVVTAYDAEELLDAARRLGPGARIDLLVTDDADACLVEALGDRAAALGDGRLQVFVRRTASLP